MKNIKQQKRYRRHKKIRAKVFGMACRPRLCVFRSAKHIYAQLINDEKGKTLVGVSDLELDRKTKKQKNKKAEKQKSRKTKKEMAYEVGKLIAEEAKKLKIEKVVFDRGGCKYHGRVKAVADAAREGGLKF